MLLTVLFTVLEKNGNNLSAQEQRWSQMGRQTVVWLHSEMLRSCKNDSTEPVISMEKRQSET